MKQPMSIFGNAIDRRKQKQKESFNEFYEAILMLADEYTIPLSQSSLLESLCANLLLEI